MKQKYNDFNQSISYVNLNEVLTANQGMLSVTVSCVQKVDKIHDVVNLILDGDSAN